MTAASGPPVGDEENLSTMGTAVENTPLLGSETASSHTARDDVPGAPGVRHDGNTYASGQPLSRRRVVCIILSMFALMFLQASNLSGMTMTQSKIAADLKAYEYAMWFTTSYMIVGAGVSPVLGRLTTIFSPGTMLLQASFFFALGALVSSQAQNVTVFLLGRVLVGVGGGGIITLSQILVVALTPKRRRGLFIGLSNAGFTIGLSSGAVVYAALLPLMGWRVLFWMQAPVGMLSGIAIYFSLPALPSHGNLKDKTVFEKLAGIDYAGALTLTLSIVLFLYGLADNIQLLPILLSVVALAAFFGIENLLAVDPIIPLSVLQSRGVLLSCLAQLGFMAARWTLLYYAPIFVLAVRGLSPTVAGAVLIPTNLGFGTGGLLVGWLHVRHAGSFWLPCLTAITVFGLALLALSFLSTATAPAALYVADVLLNGFATGAALNYTLAHLLHLAAPDTHFVVTGLLATFRSFAGSFGTAIGGGIFGRALRGALVRGFQELDGGEMLPGREGLIRKLIGGPADVFGSGLSEAENRVAVAGYEYALCILYRSAAALVVLVLAAQVGTGRGGPVTKDEEEEIAEEIAEQEAFD